MTSTTEVQTPTENVVTDRRRPGRLEQVNPALIPILRAGELPPTLDETAEYGEPDQMSGARGLVVGVALSVPLWLGILGLARWLLP